MNKDKLIEKIAFLMNDEVEAIKGYQEVIDSISDEDIIDALTEIMEDEKEHLQELTSIMFSI